MKTKQAFSLLITVATLTACGGFFGDTRREYDQKAAEKDETLTADLTLIGKDVILDTYGYPARAYLYFSSTDNTNKTDIVAVKRMGYCMTAQARVFDAKIGDKKKISEWRKQLSHKNEDLCLENAPISLNRSRHSFYWERVKE